MKILYIVSGFAPSWGLGGGVKASYELSREMASKGHDVIVYTTDIFDHKTRLSFDYKNWDGVKAYYFRTSSKFLAKMQFNFSPKLIYALYKNISSYNVIHIHEYRTVNSTLTAYLAKKNGVPYILQPHGSLPTTIGSGKFKKIYDFVCGSNILKNATILIALNKMETKQYQDLNVDEKRIKIVPNGINICEFKNLPPKGIFKNKYGINDTEKVILYLGRIDKIKGIDLLVDSFYDIINELDDVRLVIVGPDTGYLKQLKDQIKSLNLQNNVIFPGPLYGMDKLEAYVDSDVYVLPSVYDMFPNTVFEACACGIPVIVTDRCGISDIIKDKVGRVVKYDKNDLSNSIYDILNDKHLSENYGVEGKLMVNQYYNWSIIASNLENIYGNISK
ncbi:glycosyl transferase group 1 [Methanolobus psychrophilus R15]|nr:glycosyl transferase group 1 [Methanolobus psychrophilus R15]